MTESENAALGNTGLRVKLPQHAKDQRPKACLLGGGDGQGGRQACLTPGLLFLSLREPPLLGQVLLPSGGHTVLTVTRPQSSPHPSLGRHNCLGTFNFFLCFSSLLGPNPGSNQITARTEGSSIQSETVGVPGWLSWLGIRLLFSAQVVISASWE